jgi:hypothetical protein
MFSYYPKAVKVFALQICDKIGGIENPETVVPTCT